MLHKRLGIDLGTSRSRVYLDGRGIVLNKILSLFLPEWPDFPADYREKTILSSNATPAPNFEVPLE